LQKGKGRGAGAKGGHGPRKSFPRGEEERRKTVDLNGYAKAGRKTKPTYPKKVFLPLGRVSEMFPEKGKQKKGKN